MENIEYIIEQLKNYKHRNWMSREEWDKFYDNFIKSNYHTNISFIQFCIDWRDRPFHSFIDNAFNWSISNEGHTYWRIISSRQYPLK
jgi:hypothetical protein